MPEDLITLLSLDDLTQANIIKNKLETEGIECYMNDKAKGGQVRKQKFVDLRVNMKDLDRALKLIENDYRETE